MRQTSEETKGGTEMANTVAVSQVNLSSVEVKRVRWVEAQVRESATHSKEYGNEKGEYFGLGYAAALHDLVYRGVTGLWMG